MSEVAHETKIPRRPRGEDVTLPPPLPPAPPKERPVAVQPELPLEGFRRGEASIGVFTLQGRLGVPQTGVYDEWTEYSVRKFQTEYNLHPDGIAGPRVHGMLGLPWPPVQ